VEALVSRSKRMDWLWKFLIGAAAAFVGVWGYFWAFPVA
jgi:hypothetical protein